MLFKSLVVLVAITKIDYSILKTMYIITFAVSAKLYDNLYNCCQNTAVNFSSHTL